MQTLPVGALLSNLPRRGHVLSVSMEDASDLLQRLFSGQVAAEDISDAAEVGVALITAADEAAARDAIGAGTPYELPAASDELGGVLQVEAVAPATDETDIVAQFDILLASLQAAGVVAPGD